MLQLSPQTIQIIDFYSDGTDARHFSFEPRNFTHNEAIGIGQFFMLSVPGFGLAPFTYTSLPDKRGRFTALVRKVGKLTDKLFTLEKGSLLGYNGPYGKAWPLAKISTKEVLIVAGGCGLAPVATTIDYLIESGRANSVTLLYAARDRLSQVLKKERTRWQSTINLHETFDVGGDPKHSGVATKQLSFVIEKFNIQPEILLTCGPEPMMRAVAEKCIDLGLNSADIWMSIERRMRCGVGLCGHCYIGNSYACKQGPSYNYDEFIALEMNSTSVQAYPNHIQLC